MNKRRTVLYIGVTNDISRRWFEHQRKIHPNSFSARYNCDELVYVETYSDIHEAQRREKSLKGWRRVRKLDLIKKQNSELVNLF